MVLQTVEGLLKALNDQGELIVKINQFEKLEVLIMTIVPSLRMFLLLLVVLYFNSLDDVNANQKTTYQIKDVPNSPIYVTVEAVGCFRDEPSRALRTMYFNFRAKIRWHLFPDTSDIIKACAENAYNKGFFGMFAVQYYGECWSDGLADKRYNMYGKSSNCEYGVGKDWANMVYRYKVVPKPTCHVNGHEYNEGDEMVIYNNSNTADPHRSRCTMCTCTVGEAKGCKGFTCELNDQTLCLKWKYLPGQCCPVCDCYNNGQIMTVGSTWTVRTKSTCAECTCEPNNVAKCLTNNCKCNGDLVPIEIPGKCCPKCVPITTTSLPPETLPPQTERPPPILPSRPLN